MWIKVQMWIEEGGLAPYLMSTKLMKPQKMKEDHFGVKMQQQIDDTWQQDRRVKRWKGNLSFPVELQKQHRQELSTCKLAKRLILNS